ncbi:hypothetical protein RI367_004367 [Sorochytrium milnesiophthora]
MSSANYYGRSTGIADTPGQLQPLWSRPVVPSALALDSKNSPQTSAGSEPQPLTGVWQHPAVRSLDKWTSYTHSPWLALRKAGISAGAAILILLLQQTSTYRLVYSLMGRVVATPLSGLFYLSLLLALLNLLESVVTFIRPSSWGEVRDTVAGLTPAQRALLAIDPQLSRLVDAVSPVKAGVVIPRYPSVAGHQPVPLTKHEKPTSAASRSPGRGATPARSPLGAFGTSAFGQTPRHQSPFYRRPQSPAVNKEAVGKAFASATARPPTEAQSMLNAGSPITSKAELADLIRQRDAQPATLTAAQQPHWALPPVKPVIQVFQPASFGRMASVQGVVKIGTKDLAYKDPYVVRSEFGVTEEQLDRWVLGMRDWLADVVFKPLVKRMDSIDRQLADAGLGHLSMDDASPFYPVPAATATPFGASTSGFSFGSKPAATGFGGSSAFPSSTTGAFGKPAAPSFSFGSLAAPAATSAFGQPAAASNSPFGSTTAGAQSTAQSLTDLQQKFGSNEVAQGRLLLERFLSPLSSEYSASPKLRYYLLHRIRALSAGASLANFRWKQGAGSWTWKDAQGVQHTSTWQGGDDITTAHSALGASSSSTSPSLNASLLRHDGKAQDMASSSVADATKSGGQGGDTSSRMPSDAEVVMHVFCMWLDSVMPGTGKGIFGTQPFSARYFLDVVSSLDLVGRATIQLKQRTRNPPHFCLVANKCYYDVLPDRSNVFETLCLFVHYIHTHCSDYIEMLDISGQSIALSKVLDD